MNDRRRRPPRESLFESPNQWTRRARRRGSIALVALAIAACASDEEPPKVTEETPKDPAHCRFELPPEPSPTKPPNAPSAVLAGFGSAVLAMPIGAPLGGYGDRHPVLGGTPADKRASRFSTGFVPSVGMHDAPRADAVAIEAGGERLVIVRADLPLSTENSLFQLEDAVAPDGSMRGRILLAVSHSHAAWAGWQPSLALMPGRHPTATAHPPGEIAQPRVQAAGSPRAAMLRPPVDVRSPRSPGVPRSTPSSRPRAAASIRR